ncbi:hypothetical protein ES703_99012 [subsurface metagenome]
MTPSILSSLSQDVKKKLKEIAVAAFLMLMRWLIERLTSNRGDGGKGADPR